MSDFLIYIHLNPMVRDWAVGAFGEPIRFPDGSRENACILRNTIRRPEGVPVDVGKPGDVAVRIPDSKHHPPITYNHVTLHGKKELVAYVEALFTLSWQNELLYLLNEPVDLRASIRAYLSRHAISLDCEDALLRRFSRWRDKMERCGLRFRKYKRRLPSRQLKTASRNK